MNSIAEIENAVKNLSRDELSTFRAWFQEFDAEAWDVLLDETPAPQQPNDSPEGKALKAVLSAMPDVGEDEDFARPLGELLESLREGGAILRGEKPSPRRFEFTEQTPQRR